MRIARAFAAAGLALALAAVAPAAHADVDPDAEVEPCSFSNAKLSPSTVALGLSKTVTVKVSATASAGCAEDIDGATIGTDRDALDGDFMPTAGNPTQWVGTMDINPQKLDNADVTTAAVYVDLDRIAGGDDSFTVEGAELHLLRASRLDADAPSRVKKSRSFTVEGFLEKVDLDENQYVSVDDWFVDIESKPAGGKWTTMKTVMSGKGRQGGVLDFRTKIKKETCFRFVYDGFDHIAPVTAEAGCVKIK